MRTPCPKLLCATIVGALALAAAWPAHAQWKWRDRNGQITASDLPPPREIPDKDILQRPVPARVATPAPVPAPAAAPTGAAAPADAAAPPAPAKPPVDKELEAKRRAAEQQQQAKQKADEERLAQQRAENCKRARSAAATLESGQRMVRTNEKGEREVLEDAARADELRRAREIIASDCR